MKIINKKAKYDYELLDRLEVGVVLTGAEVKSAKAGHVSLAQSYVKIINDLVFLINATISPYKFASDPNYEPQRTRKLLAKKSQILALAKKLETKNLTLVPVSLYVKGNLIKFEIALARGKKQWQKREKIKERDQQRLARKALKNFN